MKNNAAIDAMEARLKQTNSVTKQAVSTSTVPVAAPVKPVHTRPATAAAQANAAAKASTENAEEKQENAAPAPAKEEVKSIIPDIPLKAETPAPAAPENKEDKADT